MASTFSRTFYKDLPAVPAAEGMCDLAHHLAVPDDWCVVIVDIVSSTVAIEAGKYKDVNMVSASAITAVLNAVDRSEVPYIFGGDGATLLVPAALVFDVAAALYGTRQMAKEAFNLDMRAGIVWMEDLQKIKSRVSVGKLEIAPGVFQAALSGDGVTAAERIVKAPDTAKTHDIETLFSTKVLASKPADFRGLECRWQPLQSRNGFDVSVIVLAREGGEAVYRDILAQISVNCGKPENWRPVSEGQLNISANPHRLSGEAKVHASGKGGGARIKSYFNTFFYACIGRACTTFGLKAGAFDGKTYKNSTTQNTDYIKFDNALRLVMDVTAGQKDVLTAYLDGLKNQGRIFYGMHAASSALMTCLVFDYASAHMHFVDGADGGYALAAKSMKQQMKDAAQAKAA
ncbi:MAG: DUF3095 family protein [Alphaproteobacteria bacterium]